MDTEMNIEKDFRAIAREEATAIFREEFSHLLEHIGGTKPSKGIVRHRAPADDDDEHTVEVNPLGMSDRLSSRITKLVAFIAAHPEGVSRDSILRKTHFTKSQYITIMAKAKENGLIRMVGDKRTALYYLNVNNPIQATISEAAEAH